MTDSLLLPRCFVNQLLRLALLLAGVLGCIHASDTQPPAGAPVVSLPPFVVEVEHSGFDSWHKTVSEHFVVYSDCDKAELDKTLSDAERIITALHKESGLPSLKLAPTVLIYPSSNSDWAKFEGRILASQSDLKKRFVTGNISSQVLDLGIVRKSNLMARALGLSRADMGVRAFAGSEFLRLHNLPYPPWFTRGIQMLAIGAEFGQNSVELGGKNKRESYYRRSSFVPWENFFSVALRGESVRQILQIDAQAGVLLRYLLTRPDPVLKAKTYQYLYYTGQGGLLSPADFVDFLGKTPADWHTHLRKFARRDPKPLSVSLTEAEAKPRIEHPEMRVSEIRDLFILAQVCKGRIETPAAVLAHLKDRSNANELLRSMLATAYMVTGSHAEASAVLTGLIQANTSNPKVYTASAKLALAGSFDSLNPDLRLPAKLGDPCLDYCRKALELEPSLKDANVLLGYALAFGETPTSEKLAELDGRIKHMEQHHFSRDLLAAKAILCARLGRQDEALQLCEALLAGNRLPDRATPLALMLGQKIKPGFHSGKAAEAPSLNSEESKPDTEGPSESEVEKIEAEAAREKAEDKD